MNWKATCSALGALVLVWGAAAVGMHWSKAQKVTAEDVVVMVSEVDLESFAPQVREEFLSNLANRVNRLDYEGRRELAMRRGLDPVIAAMSEPERVVFLERTLPQGFEQIINRFNEMNPEARQAAVDRAMADLREIELSAGAEDEQRALDRLEDGTLQRIVAGGFDAYLKHASAETKLDLAPLIEQIQRNVQGLTRR